MVFAEMMIINEDKLKQLNETSIDDIYILTDFDGTITKSNSDSSWASIFKNPKVSKKFVNTCIKIFNHYHKYEIDENISLEEKISIMNEWYQKNIQTLKDFAITEEIINYATSECMMTFRDGAKDFLKSMYDKKIPIIIISAGVGNIIEQFLIRNNCYYSNILICSNFLEYENGVVCGVKDNNLINPLNKNEIYLPKTISEKINNKNNLLLLGDSISDINMATNSSKKTVFKIGFLDENIEKRLSSFKENYDFVCINSTSYNELSEKIKVLK